MKGAVLKNKIASLVGVGVLISLFLFSSLANAASFPPEDHQPDWWNDADAKIIFDPLPTADILTATPSEGTKGYDYTARYSVLPISVPDFNINIELTSFTINLDNDESPDKTKHFWLAFHYNSSYDPTSSYVNILGHYKDGSVSPALEFDSFVTDNGWGYVEARLFPQPDREEFTIQVRGELDGKPFYNVDYLEVGTYCETPIPSSLFLLGGGILWLVNLKRRKRQ